MSMIIGEYHITYRIGDDYAEVRKIGYVDEFGRLLNQELVFRGTWAKCIAYVKGGENESCN